MEFYFDWALRDYQSPQERNGLKLYLEVFPVLWVNEELPSRLNRHTHIRGPRENNGIINHVLWEPGQTFNADQMSPAWLKGSATSDSGINKQIMGAMSSEATLLAQSRLVPSSKRVVPRISR